MLLVVKYFVKIVLRKNKRGCRAWNGPRPKRINPSSSPKPLKPYYSASKNPNTQTRFTLLLTEETSSSFSQSQSHSSTNIEKWRPFCPKPLKKSSPQKTSAPPLSNPSAAWSFRFVSAVPSKNISEVATTHFLISQMLL